MLLSLSSLLIFCLKDVCIFLLDLSPAKPFIPIKNVELGSS